MANRSKLAVIVHADVVGSTELVQIEERIAHERIQDVFRRFAERIARYGGSAHELRGDALVAEFNRASDAVTASLAFQAENHAYNQALADEIRPVIRVGIALGEVIVANQTVTGAGVVLAQRLEQIAEPGGVCVQSSVKDSVPKRFPFQFASLGERSLKGFDESVQAFAVTLRSGERLPAAEFDSAAAARSGDSSRRRAALAAAALLLVAGGAMIGWQVWTQAPDAASGASATQAPAAAVSSTVAARAGARGQRSGPALPNTPSIAVLPFDNMSTDAEQEYFADGITEDLITDLSKIAGLFVIARNSSFSYKGRSVDVRTVALELGVRYVLEGSVRRAGEQARINAQLIDAISGGHLWADRYDGSLADVFGFQDQVTRNIVAALAVALAPAERAALSGRGTSNPRAHDAYLRGLRHLNSRDDVRADENDKARREFTAAIEFDPDYANALAALGLTYWDRWARFDVFDFAAKRKGIEFAERSLSLADNAMAHRVLARKYLFLEGYQGVSSERDHALAIAEMRKARQLEPNNADILAELAYYLVFSAELDEAQSLLARAKRLNPYFPAWYYRPSGFVHFGKRDYAGAITDFTAWYENEAIPRRSAYALASAFAHAGEVAKAKSVLDIFPKVTNTSRHNDLGWVRQFFPFQRAQDLEHLLDGLREAGMLDSQARRSSPAART